MRGLRALLLAGVLAALPAGPGQALTVYDGANHAQNILTAARTLLATRHLGEMVAGLTLNLRGLAYDAGGLLATGAAWLRLLFEEAPGVAWDRPAAATEMDTLYPELIAPDVARAVHVQEEAVRTTSIRSGWLHSHDVQTGMVAENQATEAVVADLVSGSQSAVGALAVMQAGNQIGALQVRELLRTQALLAAHQRAGAAERLRLDTEGRSARARFGASIGTGNLYTPLP